MVLFRTMDRVRVHVHTDICRRIITDSELLTMGPRSYGPTIFTPFKPPS